SRCSLSVGPARVDDVRRFALAALGVLTTGRAPPTPGELRDSDKMTLLKAATARYDTLIVDSAPPAPSRRPHGARSARVRDPDGRRQWEGTSAPSRPGTAQAGDCAAPHPGDRAEPRSAKRTQCILGAVRCTCRERAQPRGRLA